MRRASAAIWRKTRYIPLRKSSSTVNLPPTTQITTLPNKIRVATDNRPGHFSSVGLYVDAGARHETQHTSGVFHFLDRMAFKVNHCIPAFLYAILLIINLQQSTASRSGEQMASAIDSLGGQIMCSSSRESMMYQSSHAHKGTPLALSLIADTVLNPSFNRDELDVQRDAAAYELREMNSKPDMFLPEVIHSVAYNEMGLGNPMLCPEDRLNNIDEGLLRHALQEWYRPEKMVIAGAGMPHDELIELTNKFFSSLKSSSIQPAQHRLTPNTNNAQLPPHLLSPSSPSVAKTLTRAASYLFPNSISSPLSGVTPAIPKSPTSTYTGGHRFILDTKEQLNHLYIAFEGLGIEDDDVYALAVMQVLLGGGGSFSAGIFSSFFETS